MRRRDIIEERGGEFFILSKEGEELEGPIPNEEQANERLRQIEAAKAERGKVPKPKADDSFRRYDYIRTPLHTDEHRTDGLFMEETPEGFLRADARPARTGVLVYQDGDGNRWGELRTEGEVFNDESLRSFDLAVVTDEHPADFVNSDNVKDVQVGSVGTDARRDGRFVRASIVVTDSKVIRAIKDGKRELSCGYTAQVISERGVADDGTSFAGRQTNIRINHVAVVASGRAGTECSVLARGDAFTLLTTNEVDTMKTKTIKIGDADFTVPEAVADALQAKHDADVTLDNDTIKTLRDAGALDAKGKVPPAFLKAKGKGEEEEEEDEPDAKAKAAAAKDKSKDSDSDLRAKVDMLETQRKADADMFNVRVDARSKLITNAVSILGNEAKTDGTTDAALMRAVVLKVQPNMESKLDANKADGGYLRACYDQAVDFHARRDVATEDTNNVIFDALSGGEGGGDIFEDALTQYANRGNAAVEA